VAGARPLVVIAAAHRGGAPGGGLGWTRRGEGEEKQARDGGSARRLQWPVWG
jgi:hypothetical protein